MVTVSGRASPDRWATTTLNPKPQTDEDAKIKQAPAAPAAVPVAAAVPVTSAATTAASLVQTLGFRACIW